MIPRLVSVAALALVALTGCYKITYTNGGPASMAPPGPAPTLSLPVEARKLGPCRHCATWSANAGVSECTVTAVGRPSATSRANEGRVTNARGVPAASIDAGTAWRKRPEPGAKA